MPDVFVCTSNATNYDVCKVVAELRKTTSALQRFLTVVSGSFLETQFIFHGWPSRGGLNAAIVNHSQHCRPVPQVRAQVEELIEARTYAGFSS